MAGEVIKKPNMLHKFIHRIAMIRPVTEFFATRLHRIDGFILKLTDQKYTAAEIIGWPIIQLTTTGAKSGVRRTMPLIAVFDNEKIALIASSFGREHNPGWYYNLKAHPRCSVTFRGKESEFIARQLEGDEREKYWQLALSFYQGYDAYKKRASHRVIPVMLLEPVKERISASV
jgi:deazaflavin-dependent oxidoreductase (nitroreductase family)